jgi:hypothetical protein
MNGSLHACDADAVVRVGCEVVWRAARPEVELGISGSSVSEAAPALTSGPAPHTGLPHSRLPMTGPG